MRLLIGLLLAGGAFAQAPVSIQVGPGTEGAWRPVWRSFGYDEPNYTCMTDGKIAVGDCRAEPACGACAGA